MDLCEATVITATDNEQVLAQNAVRCLSIESVIIYGQLTGVHRVCTDEAVNKHQHTMLTAGDHVFPSTA